MNELNLLSTSNNDSPSAILNFLSSKDNFVKSTGKSLMYFTPNSLSFIFHQV